MASAWRAAVRSRDFSPSHLLGLIEYLMIALLGVLGLALIWAMTASTGSFGKRIGSGSRVDASPSVFAAFDPFFRLSGGDSQSMVVTPLNLTLYGIRADRASGRGSAIIGLPDGTQNSYAVGDPIMAGAVLAGVTFDSVTIQHNGAAEKLYLDQSTAAPVVKVGTAAASAGPDPFAAVRAPGTGPRTPMLRDGKAALMSDVVLSPRDRGGKVDGYILQPGPGGDAFRNAGLKPGDVLVGINGTKLSDGIGAQRFTQAVEGIGEATLAIERDGRPVSVTIGRNR